MWILWELDLTHKKTYINSWNYVVLQIKYTEIEKKKCVFDLEKIAKM